MNDFEILLDKFKIDCESSIFEEMYKQSPIFFFQKILDRLLFNYQNPNSERLKENISLLVIIFQLYPDSNEELEKFTATKITQLFLLFISFYFQGKYIDVDSDNFLCLKNIFLFIDIFFHNPYFVEYIQDSDRNKFVESLVRLTEIKYDVDCDTETQLFIQYSVTVFFYFSESIIEPYKNNFQNHFDESVVEEFNFLNE